jgi:hypothetical protein
VLAFAKQNLVSDGDRVGAEQQRGSVSACVGTDTHDRGLHFLALL